MLSVVIPAFNEEQYLGDCLEAFCRQKNAAAFEVIVVDNNSTDATAAVAHLYVGKLPLTLIGESRQGRGAARYAGCANGKGSILCTIDADIIVAEDWLQKIQAAFDADGSLVGITTPAIIRTEKPRLQTLHRLLEPVYMRMFRLFYGHVYLSGCSLAVRRDAYEKSGGFDPENDGPDDIALTFKIAPFGRLAYLRTTHVTIADRRYRDGYFRARLYYVSLFLRRFLLRQKVRQKNVR